MLVHERGGAMEVVSAPFEVKGADIDVGARLQTKESTRVTSSQKPGSRQKSLSH